MPPLSFTEKTIAVFAALLPALSFLAILICCIQLGAF